VEQMNGKWRVRDAKLRPLADRARELLARFPKWKLRHIPRDQNAVADLLANRAIDEVR
jgi:ribonuclease HI